MVRPPTGFPSIACVWPTNWLLLTAAGSQRGSRDQFPAELSREKTPTFNHRIQRPPVRQPEVTSWESRSQSQLGPRETRPDPKADRCSSDAGEDATEQGHRCDPCSQRQFTPIHKSETRLREAEQLPEATQHVTNQQAGRACPSPLRSAAPPARAGVARGPGRAPRVCFMNERTKRRKARASHATRLGRRHLLLFFLLLLLWKSKPQT